MYTHKLSPKPASADTSNPPARGKQPVDSEDCATSPEVDVLTETTAKLASATLGTPDTSRHASPARGQPVQIAMAVKSPRRAVTGTEPPAWVSASAAGGRTRHSHDVAEKLLHTDQGTYVLGESVGKGSFGEIMQAVGPLGHPVVVKIVDMAQDLAEADGEAAKNDVYKKHRREFTAMTKAHAGYQPLDLAQVGDKLFIALPPLRVHMADEDLRAMVDAKAAPHVANCMFHDVSGDLARVHGQGWLHRDLKLENFMTDSRGHVVLIDYGESMALPPSKELVTRAKYASPELFAPETFLPWDKSLFEGDPALAGERRDTPASEMFALGLCWAAVALNRDAHPFDFNPEAHTAWLDGVHAALPVDDATGLLDLPALEALAAKPKNTREEANLYKFALDMGRAHLRMGSFVALRVLHRDPAQRPTAAQGRDFGTPESHDLAHGRRLLQMPVRADGEKQKQLEKLIARHEALLEAR